MNIKYQGLNSSTEFSALSMRDVRSNRNPPIGLRSLPIREERRTF